jgi:acyl carrier protein
MGLDTVEVAYSLERYFGVEIPDMVSESIYTVGDAATWFSQELGVVGQRWLSK